MTSQPERENGRPRLLLAVDLYPDGGGISAIVENSLQLLRDDYDVHVAIVDEREGRRESLDLPDDHVHAFGTRPLLKPYLAPTSLFYSLRVGWRLRRLVRRLRPAALLVQDGLFLPVPGLIATRGFPTRLAVMDHGTLTNSLDRRWQRLFPRQLNFPRSLVYRVGVALDTPWRELRWRIGFRAADAVWYVGEEMKPLLRHAGARARQYKQPAPLHFRPPSARERQAARAELGIDGEQVVVNMVTRLSFEKGLPEVLEALERLALEHPRLRLVLAGQGPLEPWLREQATVRDVGEWLVFVGSLERPAIQRLHHASDFHLYAGTLGCGMSLALLEAMAAAVIPIVSDVPGEQRELCEGPGWVFRAGDGKALEHALASALAADAEELERRREQTLAALRGYTRPSVKDLVDELVA